MEEKNDIKNKRKTNYLHFEKWLRPKLTFTYERALWPLSGNESDCLAVCSVGFIAAINKSAETKINFIETAVKPTTAAIIESPLRRRIGVKCLLGLVHKCLRTLFTEWLVRCVRPPQIPMNDNKMKKKKTVYTLREYMRVPLLSTISYS